MVKPIRLALLWMVFWGFWTALLRPIVGMPIWDFVERWANWGAPLALLLLVGWPKTFKPPSPKGEGIDPRLKGD